MSSQDKQNKGERKGREGKGKNPTMEFFLPEIQIPKVIQYSVLFVLYSATVYNYKDNTHSRVLCVAINNYSV